MDVELLKKLDQEVLIALILKQSEQIERLTERVKALEEQGAKNSRNSSKPPSSDGFKKSKSLREKGQRKTGGQKGHTGKTLTLVSEPTAIVRHRLETCPECQHDLSRVLPEKLEKRQVFDIPSVNLVVTEHQAEVKTCAGCRKGVKAVFPKGVENPVQYGEVLKAQIAYLSAYQLLPGGRLVELLADFYGQSLSEDTVLGVLETLAQAVQPSLVGIRQELLTSDVLHADETGLRVNQKTEWLHVLSTSQLTYYAVQPKRGQIALRQIGLVPEFKGRLLHDAYASYWTFEQCQHALCNAHILRELRFLHEEQDQSWAGELKNLLVNMKKAVATAHPAGKLAPEVLASFTQGYTELLAQGWQANPPPAKPDLPKRGRLKHSTAQNLLQRLAKYQSAV